MQHIQNKNPKLILRILLECSTMSLDTYFILKNETDAIKYKLCKLLLFFISFELTGKHERNMSILFVLFIGVVS